MGSEVFGPVLWHGQNHVDWTSGNVTRALAAIRMLLGQPHPWWKGHDPEGREIPGKTWVTEHEKGTTEAG